MNPVESWKLRVYPAINSNLIISYIDFIEYVTSQYLYGFFADLSVFAIRADTNLPNSAPTWTTVTIMNPALASRILAMVDEI